MQQKSIFPGPEILHTNPNPDPDPNPRKKPILFQFFTHNFHVFKKKSNFKCLVSCHAALYAFMLIRN